VEYLPRGEIAVDLSLIPPGLVIDNVPAAILGFDSLRARHRKVSPVVSLHADEAQLPLLRRVVSEHGHGVVIRLDGDDIRFPRETGLALSALLNALEVTPQESSLAVDLGSITLPVRSIAPRIENLLRIPLMQQFRTLSVGGSSLPKFVTESGAEENGNASIRRLELDLVEKLRGSSNLPRISLLDHGIVHPDHMDEIKNKHMNGKLRYTHGAFVHFFRGRSKAKEPLRSQFPDLVRRVVSSPTYRGRIYSAGDEFLYKCAFEGKRCADLGEWVCVDNNHHLTATARQMLALRSSAPTKSDRELDEVLSPV
jgi:hypothetical protein